MSIKDLPEIHAVLVSHDHYDHLDYPTIRALAKTQIPFVTSLGVGAHLEAWGVPASTEEHPWSSRLGFWTREYFARHLAYLDVWFPPDTLLGPREPTPDDWLTEPVQMGTP